VKVELSEEAEAQVATIDAWWRENRQAAPDLFSNELDRMLKTLGEMPSLGTAYQARRGTIRRVLLRRTHYPPVFRRRS
jgi:plasmid stabilization system protein ParE